MDFGNADGIASNFSLYVPKREGDKGLGICPGAGQLSQVNSQCTDIYYLSGSESNVSEVIINNTTYWKVEGLSGTGGFSVGELPETGIKIQNGYFIGIILLMFVVRNILKPTICNQ